MPKVIGGPLEVGNVEIEPAVVVIIPKRDAHGGHHSSLGGESHAADNSDFFECSVALVVVEIGIEAIVSHEQIRPAVIVIIGGADGKILAFRLIDFRRNRYVSERAVAVVVIERVRTAAINARRTTAKHAP